jgi:hypothetical protein
MKKRAFEFRARAAKALTAGGSQQMYTNVDRRVSSAVNSPRCQLKQNRSLGHKEGL